MRHRRSTATKGGWCPEDLVRAVDEVVKNGMSERKAAQSFNVKRSTLKRRLKEARSCPGGLRMSSTMPYQKASMKIFSAAEEMQLVEYCLSASKMGYGLSTIKLRELAYEFAMKLNKRMPHSRGGRPNPWITNKQAGEDWLRAFFRRHQGLSIRKPEATSIGRMSAFNRHNVDLFYNNVHEVLTKYHFQPSNIWNCDETGVTTVQVPERVIAGKGERQVASVTSAERGTLVTMCNAINACGVAVPPFYIFPRVNFKDIFLKNGPPGCAGTAQVTGWMVESTFVEWFRHFLKHVHPSKDDPILLILDNHETHMSIDFIDLASENGVVVVTIPPHTSHKLQPLDISVYGPFKRLYNREIDSWLVSHPGKTVSIYDIAEISGAAWSKASMPANLISGFSSAGVYPFQPDKWMDEDFALAQVTDRPMPTVSEPSTSAHGLELEASAALSATLTTPIHSPAPPLPRDGQLATQLVNTDLQPTASTSVVTPLSVRPLPKAGVRQPRKQGGGRKKLSSTILTKTPVKEALRVEQGARKVKSLALAMKREKGKANKCKKSKTSTRLRPELSDEDELEVSDGDFCDDDSLNDEAEGNVIRSVRRKLGPNATASDHCTVCGEIGKDKEMWYRCRICSFWAHEACTASPSAASYVCDHCQESQKPAGLKKN